MKLQIMLLAEQAQEGLFFNQILMFGLIGLVFYFFMLRPQIKRSKEAKAFREGLAVGDKIITVGGIHGKVLEINESTIMISTEGAGKLRVEKGSVSANPQDLMSNQKK